MADKTISVYGKVTRVSTYKQRYWHRRKDGVKQRYWHKVTRTQRMGKAYRFDFRGRGKDIYKAVAEAKGKKGEEGWIPKKRYTEKPISAKEFVERPEKYGRRGIWRAEAESPWKCCQCGYLNPPDTNICEECGHRKCRNCG